MGVEIIKDSTSQVKLSTELVITLSAGNAYTITEGGNALVGDYNGQTLFLVDTTDAYVYYKTKWYLI